MDFDQTYIAIRKRNLLEIVDLSLHVIRDHLRPLFLLWLIGTLPLMIVNWLMIGWLTEDYYDFERINLYIYVMALLVINQSQVGCAFVTSYLGKAIFSERPSTFDAVKSTITTNPYYIWVHGILRAVIPALAIAALIRPEADDESLTAAVVWLSIVVGLGLIVRCARPFATEILSLEKTPVFKKKNGSVHYSLRSASLHKAANAELMGRFVLVSILSLPLLIAILGTLLTADYLMNLHANAESLPVVFYWPIAAWMVAGIFAVVRFLSYIDIRIRQEGWEVELRMRAEATRLEKILGVADV